MFISFIGQLFFVLLFTFVFAAIAVFLYFFVDSILDSQDKVTISTRRVFNRFYTVFLVVGVFYSVFRAYIFYYN